MNTVQTMLDIGRNQCLNAARLLRGQPVTTPSFASMTLDPDDVEIAERLLAVRSDWDDEEVLNQYQRQFADWNGSRHAYAFMSGREALSACIDALELVPGDEVIVPGYTCVVVANAFRYAGINPVFVDIELDTYGVDAADLARKMSPRTRAIVVHHLYGLISRDCLEVIDLARRLGVKVIEDCAHSTGAMLDGLRVGNLGDVSFFSTERSKVFSTIVGGLAATNDDAIGARLKEFHQAAAAPDHKTTSTVLNNVILDYNGFKHAQRWWRRDLAVLQRRQGHLISTTRAEERGSRPSGYGRRMSSPIAAIGLNQLGKVDCYNQQRARTAQKWHEWCDSSGYRKPLVVEGSQPIFLRYPVLVEAERKANTEWALGELNVSLGVWFVSNLHPASCHVEGCPNADRAVDQCVNLPTLVD